MFEGWLLLLGGVEIVLGGLMTAYPTLLPQWVGYVIVGIGVLTILFAFNKIRRDTWQWILRKAQAQYHALHSVSAGEADRAAAAARRADLRMNLATALAEFGEFARHYRPEMGNPDENAEFLARRDRAWNLNAQMTYDEELAAECRRYIKMGMLLAGRIWRSENHALTSINLTEIGKPIFKNLHGS